MPTPSFHVARTEDLPRILKLLADDVIASASNTHPSPAEYLKIFAKI